MTKKIIWFWQKKKKSEPKDLNCPFCNRSLERVHRTSGKGCFFLMCELCDRFFLSLQELEKAKLDVAQGEKMKKQYEFTGGTTYI